MKFVSIAENDLEYRNTHGLQTNTPYVIDDQDRLVLDIGWWQSQECPKLFQTLIFKHFNHDFVLRKVKIPHEPQKDDRLTIVFKLYQQCFEFHNWFNGKPEGSIIIKQSDPKLLEKLQREMQKSEATKFFFKNSATSGKNEKSITPITSPQQVLELIKQDRFKDRANDDTHLILIPWNDRINNRNEIRAFVYNGRLVAASQQFWHRCHNYTQKDLENIGIALIKFDWNKLRYKCCVVDGFVVDNTFYLIELNCFGDHSGAGSSLFEWEQDHDLLYGKKDTIEFRFVSIAKMDFKMDFL